MAPSHDQIIALHRQFGDITALLHRHETTIGTIAAEGHSRTVAYLELAMTKLFKVALYVHGNYDSAHDPTAAKALKESAVAAFELVKDTAETALNALLSTHTQIVEIKNREVYDFRKHVEELLQDIEKEISKATNRMREIENEVEQMENKKRADQAFVSNNEELSKSPLLDVAFGTMEGLAWLGGQTAKIWGDYGYDNCEKPLETLRKARQSITDANIRIASYQRQLAEVQAEYSVLKNLKEGAEALKPKVPELVSESENLVQRAEEMQKVLIDLKATTAQLVTEVKIIDSAAEYVESTLDMKANIASSILDVCQSALIDRNVVDEVRMIMEELSKGYDGMVMPKRVRKGLEETTKILETSPLLAVTA